MECVYSQSCGCVRVHGLSSIEVARQMFAIVSTASSSILSIACQSLGFFLDFEHQSWSPLDVLDEYERKLISFTFKPVHECVLGIFHSSFEGVLIVRYTRLICNGRFKQIAPRSCCSHI